MITIKTLNSPLVSHRKASYINKIEHINIFANIVLIEQE